MILENMTRDVRLTIEGVYENHPVKHNNNLSKLGRFDTNAFDPLLRGLNDIGIKSTNVSYADLHTGNYENNDVAIKTNRANLRFIFNHGGECKNICVNGILNLIEQGYQNAHIRQTHRSAT